MGRLLKLIISAVMIIVLAPNYVFAEEEIEYIIKAVWNDNANLYNTRPDQLSFTISNENQMYYEGSLYEKDGWETTVQIPDEWENPEIILESVDGYKTSVKITGNEYIETYSADYLNKNDRIIVDTIWVDGLSEDRPESYTLNLENTSTGESYEYTIGKDQTEFYIDDIPFMEDGGKVNLTASINELEDYTAEIEMDEGLSGRVFTAVLTNASADGDSLPDGYSRHTQGNATIYTYKQSGNEKIALVSLTDDGSYGAIPISNFKLSGKKIKAIINANYFMMYNGSAILGRAQGLSMGSRGYIDNRTPGPDDPNFSWYSSAYPKAFKDLVIDQDNSVHWGNFNSWDYPYSESGSTGLIKMGVAPGAILMINGTQFLDYSPEAGRNKLTTINTQTGLARTTDNKWVLMVASNASPQSDMYPFVAAHGMNHLSIYDGGGSSQMVVNGETVFAASNRNIPDAIVIYEDEGAVSTTAVKISFVDTDANSPQDLSAYTIRKSVTLGSTASTGIATIINQLRNAGYEPVDDSWQQLATVDESTASYSVQMKHIVTETTSTETFTRTILFKCGDATIRSSDAQRLKKTTTAVTDQVTGVTYSSPQISWENNISRFPAYAAPAIDGYLPQTDSLPEAEAENMTVELQYSLSGNLKVIDLSDNNKVIRTMNVSGPVGSTINTSSLRSELTAQNYLIQSADTVFQKGVNEYLIEVIHKTRKNYTSEHTPAGLVRTIHAVFPDGSSETLTQEIESYLYDKGTYDYVTGEFISDVERHYVINAEEYILPEINGLVPSIASLPAIDNFDYKEINLPQLDYEVSYSEYIEYINYAIELVDRDDNDLVLDTVVGTDAVGTTIDISEKVNLLRDNNYLIDQDSVTLQKGTSTYTIDVRHNIVENYEGPSMTTDFISREVTCSYSDNPDLICVTKYYSDTGTFKQIGTRDLVTRKFTASDSYHYYVTLQEVHIEEVEGYTPDIAVLPEETEDYIDTDTRTHTYHINYIKNGTEAENTATLKINTSTDVIVDADADKDGMIFAGWALSEDGDVKYPAYQKFTVRTDTELFPVFTEDSSSYALDVNARVNGRYSGNTNGIATFDVYVNGNLVKEQAVDFYKKYPAGTEFEIKNIQVSDGYTFTGVSPLKSYAGTYSTGSLSGKTAAGITDIALSFISDDYTGTAGNVAKDLSIPVLQTTIEDESKEYTAYRPDKTYGFSHWNENNEAEWEEMHYLDVNAKIDGKFSGNTSSAGTFDMFINGEMLVHNATDFYKLFAPGTAYELKNIKAKDGIEFIGMNGRPSSAAYQILTDLDGVMPDSKSELMPMFENHIVSNYVDINGLVDGKYKGNLSGFATFDVYADGKKVADQVTDFYKKYPVGTVIEVSNIVTADGYEYSEPAERKSYGGVYHQTSLIFNVGGESVNDLLLTISSNLKNDPVEEIPVDTEEFVTEEISEESETETEAYESADEEVSETSFE